MEIQLRKLVLFESGEMLVTGEEQRSCLHINRARSVCIILNMRLQAIHCDKSLPPPHGTL